MMRSTLDYLLAILLILSCNTIYSTSVNFNFYITELLVVIMGINVLFCLVNYKKGKVRKKTIVGFFLYFCYIVLFFLVNNIKNKYNFIGNYFFILPMSMILFRKNDEKKFFLEKILNITVIIGCISLFFYIFGSIGNIIKTNKSIFISWGRVKSVPTYFGLHSNIQKTGHIWRNTSFFTEAPMYSLILTIALGIELFLSEKKSKSKCIILIISVISTFSTTGILLVTLMVILNFWEKRKEKKEIIKKIVWFIIVPIVIVSIVIIAYNSMNNKIGSASYIARMDDYLAGIKAWKKKPIFGNGYGDKEEIINNMSSFRITEKGLSNSITTSLAENGMYLTSIYIIAFANAIIYSIKVKNKGILYFSVVIMFLFITTIFLFNQILMVLVAMGLTIGYREKGELKHEI